MSEERIPEVLRLSLLGFAQEVMRQRKPDFTAGDQYLERWRLAEYGQGANAYIHRFTGDDEDAAAHDHPYDNVSIILDTGYFEWFHCKPLTVVDGKYEMYPVVRRPGEVVTRDADVAHRLSMHRDAAGVIVPAVSLFLPGPRVREWGFHCVKGWVHYKEFLTENGGRIGCGQ